MTRNDLAKRVKQRPFIPFRVVLTEGPPYEVCRPDFVMIGRDNVTIGLPGEQEQEFFESFVVVDLLHVVKLEPIPGHAASTGKP